MLRLLKKETSFVCQPERFETVFRKLVDHC